MQLRTTITCSCASVTVLRVDCKKLKNCQSPAGGYVHCSGTNTQELKNVFLSIVKVAYDTQTHEYSHSFEGSHKSIASPKFA